MTINTNPPAAQITSNKNSGIVAINQLNSAMAVKSNFNETNVIADPSTIKKASMMPKKTFSLEGGNDVRWVIRRV